MNINTNVQEYELHQVIAQGCLTNSKHPDRFIAGVYPQVISHGHKCYLYDMNDKKYLDFICGLGANLFGYGNDKIKSQILKHLYNGESHSFPTKWEVIAANKVISCFPWVEKVKFLNDGSSACSAAVTIARSYHKFFGSEIRNIVLSDGYHGWHSGFVQLTPPANGIVKDERTKLLKDIKKHTPNRISAIIVEPIILDNGKERLEYLRWLRDFCSENDIVLIFDETITGLRYPKLSVSNCYGITPDLLIFGKALGNGEKISCIAGKSKHMEGDYFVSGTYHGHVPSLIAATVCLHLAKNNSNYDIDYLMKEGLHFQEEFNRICDGIICLKGYGTRGAFMGEPINKALFMQEMCKSGILFGPSFFLNWDLVPHLKEVLYITERIIDKIKNGDVVLEGKLPSSPFPQKVRNL